jgi:integrase
MAKSPKFAVVETPKGWRVRVPSSISDTGKDQTRFFKSRRKAEDFATTQRKGYRNHGERHSVLPPRVADDALAAWVLLEPLGITLTQAARAAVARDTMVKGSVSVTKAVAAWEEWNENRLRKSTLASYTLTAGLLTSAHAETTLAEVTAAEIAACIAGKSYAMHRRNMSAFFKWAAAAPRRWCDPAVLADVPVVRTSNDHDITVLRPAEVLALLCVAEKHYPETVPVYAIGFFAGVRVEERSRLTAVEFSNEGIEIGSAVAKKRRRRYVPLNDTLAAWLKRYPFQACSNFSEKDKAVRRLAGWDVEARLLKNPPDPTRGEWPRNVIRHTHASAEIANGATLEDLLFRFGHTDKAETLRSHYVGQYRKSEAEEFFAIRPSDQGSIT